MKITNAIMTANEDFFYESYWPYVSELWEHFGVHPILVYVTKDINKPFPYPSKFGEIIPTLSVANSVYEALACRHLAAAVIPGLNYVTDIDLIPCNRKFIDVVEKMFDEENKDIVMLCRDYSPLYSTGMVVATSQLFKNIYAANGIYPTREDFWNDQIIDKLFRGEPRDFSRKVSPLVWRDGVQLSDCVQAYRGSNKLLIKPIDTGHTGWGFEWGWDEGEDNNLENILAQTAIKGVKNGSIWQIHLNDRYKEIVRSIRDIVMQENL